MVEVNNKTRSRINLILVKKVAKEFVKYYNIKSRLAATPQSGRQAKSDHTNVNNVEISIAFVGDKTIRRLNKTYRGIDRTTDVLAFLGEGDSLGEVVINWAQIKRQAGRYTKNIKKELVFVLVHGLLHLTGHGDKTEKERRKMERRGEEFMKFLNYNF